MVRIAQMPNHSRVWIFQADRNLHAQEIAVFEKKSKVFLLKWKAHGDALAATMQLIYDRFIVVAVDENQTKASGCSIDACTQFIQQLGAAFQIDFFGRTTVAYKFQSEEIQFMNMNAFSEFLRTAENPKSIVVFNNLVSTVDDFNKNWETTVSNSWHAQLIN